MACVMVDSNCYGVCRLQMIDSLCLHIKRFLPLVWFLQTEVYLLDHRIQLLGSSFEFEINLSVT